MKRLLSLLLASLLLFSLFVPACADQEEVVKYTSGDFFYTLDVNGNASITRWIGIEESLTIPESLDGHSVTSIGHGAFFERMSLTSVTIPDSVTSIGYSAFQWCNSLSRVTIPDSVVSMGANPFAGCPAKIIISPAHPVFATIDGALFNKQTKELIFYPYGSDASSYAVPQGIRSIGEDAFSRCNSLSSVTIPDSVTSIGDGAFNWCESLSSVTIPDSVTSIGECVFMLCQSLRSVTIPDSVVSIGDEAFDFRVTLTVGPDSFALSYAKENGYSYIYPEADTDWLTK